MQPVNYVIMHLFFTTFRNLHTLFTDISSGGQSASPDEKHYNGHRKSLCVGDIEWVASSRMGPDRHHIRLLGFRFQAGKSEFSSTSGECIAYMCHIPSYYK